MYGQSVRLPLGRGLRGDVKGCRQRGGCWWACANRLRSSDVGCALRLHCNKNPIYVFPEKELRGLSPNFHTECVCERFVYSQYRSAYKSCRKICGPILGIYNSLTDTWMCQLGLKPHNSFSGNICFDFLVLCLCSVRSIVARIGVRPGWWNSAISYAYKMSLKIYNPLFNSPPCQWK